MRHSSKVSTPDSPLSSSRALARELVGHVGVYLPCSIQNKSYINEFDEFTDSADHDGYNDKSSGTGGCKIVE